MNIRHRLQQLDKENIQKICSQMGIKNHGDKTKTQLITTLLLPLQTYKMKTKNPKKPKKKTIVRPPKYYEEKRMKELAERLQKLNINKSTEKQPYKPTTEQQRRILELMKK